MNRAARILLIILGVLIGLALVLSVAFMTITRSPFPDVDGEKAMKLPETCQGITEQEAEGR